MGGVPVQVSQRKIDSTVGSHSSSCRRQTSPLDHNRSHQKEKEKKKESQHQLGCEHILRRDKGETLPTPPTLPSLLRHRSPESPTGPMTPQRATAVRRQETAWEEPTKVKAVGGQEDRVGKTRGFPHMALGLSSSVLPLMCCVQLVWLKRRWLPQDEAVCR